MSKEFNKDGGPFGDKSGRGGRRSSGGGEQPNGVFTAFVVAVFALALISQGPQAIVETVENIAEMFDKDATNSSNSTKHKVKNKAGIDKDDIEKILEFIDDNSTDTQTNVVFLKYSYLKNEKTYKKKVIDRLKWYSKDTTFVFVNTKKLEADKMQTEIDRVNNIYYGTNSLLSDTKFSKSSAFSITNRPGSGNITFAITIKK